MNCCKIHIPPPNGGAKEGNTKYDAALQEKYNIINCSENEAHQTKSVLDKGYTLGEASYKILPGFGVNISDSLLRFRYSFGVQPYLFLKVSI